MTIANALLKTMRPRQWAKNGFVFAGILFDKQFTEAASVQRVLAAFLLLCLSASTIYIINDIVDVEKDRLHPRKKHRPIAAGKLPVPVATNFAALFVIASVGGALLFSPPLAGVIVAYLLLHLIYSFILKSIILLDVFAIAGGFVLRVIAGVVVIEVQQFSPWLYVCAGLLALFLAIGKRRQELLLLGEKAENVRDTYSEYNLPLLDDMLRLVLACTAIAYTLYSTEAETVLAKADFMLLTVPFVYYGLFRYLYVIHVKGEGGDPTDVLFMDRPLQIDIGLWLIFVTALLYVV